MTEPKESQHAGVFISYVHEDSTFVKELAQILIDVGVAVWLDRIAMKSGDSLSHRIDSGIKQSAWGVIVISPDFIAKTTARGWSDYEYRSFVARQIGEPGAGIVPVWLERVSHMRGRLAAVW